MARLSLAAQITTPGPVVTLKTAPKPPSYFSSEEKKLWEKIVGCNPVDWFTEGDLPLLVAYCQAVSLHTKAQEELSTQPLTFTNPNNGMPYNNPLVGQAAQAAKLMASMATKLRLSQSTRVHPMSGATRVRKHAQSPDKKPWD